MKSKQQIAYTRFWEQNTEMEEAVRKLRSLARVWAEVAGIEESTAFSQIVVDEVFDSEATPPSKAVDTGKILHQVLNGWSEDVPTFEGES